MEYFKEGSVMVAETFDDYDDQRHKLINERDMLWAELMLGLICLFLI